MVLIDKSQSYFASSQILSSILDDEWKLIEYQKHSFLISDDCDLSFLKYPGFIFSNIEASNAYKRIYKDFIDNNIYTQSRGNLSKSNNYIFIGIRPGHVYAHLSKADTAWLFGPSSVLLHKLLISLNIYPYFTNIYNEPDKPFNKDFKFIFKELFIISYIYKVIYHMNELNLVFMGNYDEYPLFVNYIRNHNSFKQLNMKLNCLSIWHPGFLARGYDDNKLECWKNQIINKEKVL